MQMSLSRRDFLEVTFKTVVVIGVGNTLQSFSARHFPLPDKKEVLLRFALASDGHFGEPKTEFDAMHDDMVGWLNREAGRRGTRFCHRQR